MNYVRLALAGTTGAAIGWLLTLGAAHLFGFADFRGGSAMIAVLGVGPVGGLAGLVFGIALSLYLRGVPGSFLSIAERVWTVVAVILVFIASAIFIVIYNLDRMAWQ